MQKGKTKGIVTEASTLVFFNNKGRNARFTVFLPI